MNVKFSLLITLLLLSISSFSQTPCEDGMAGLYPCFGVDLQAVVTPQELGAEDLNGRWVNDIWGWTDPDTNKEYALVGMTNGTSFIDISDPVNPIVLGVLKEHNWDIVDEESESSRLMHAGAKSIWRDIKVYKNYAYIVSEDDDHGIQVFDLTDLRDVEEMPADFQEAGHYDGVGQAHNIFINEETGYLYAVGFRQDERTCSEGGLHIVDLTDPVNPVYAGCYDDSGYIHDTQCVIYDGPDSDYIGNEICFNSNATAESNTITITDVSNKTAPVLLSAQGYTSSFYAHQGWLTEDHKYFLSNDELDESNTGLNTRTLIWDVQNLENPELIGTFTHKTKAIDHNLYIKNNLVYESNYTNGLRILDATNVSEGLLTESLFFDVHPENDETAFWGTWSNYPFFESGNVIVSDFSRGLFILTPRTDLVLNTTELSEGIKVYPNPADDEITIELTSSKSADFQLMNLNGQVVHTARIDLRATFQLSDFESGLYLLKIISDNYEMTRKILIR